MQRTPRKRKVTNTETRRKDRNKEQGIKNKKTVTDAKLQENEIIKNVKNGKELEERRRLPRKPTHTPKFEFKKENLKIIPLRWFR